MGRSTTAEALGRARDNLVTALETATENPKPAYNLDGHTVNFEQYIDSLIRQIRQLEEAIADAEGPFEVQTRATT